MAAEAPQRRTQAERRNGSEDALLAAAAELIAERGIDRSTLAGIGERAGTSRGLPTHYFIGRDGKIRDLAIGGLKPNGMRSRLAKIVG